MVVSSSRYVSTENLGFPVSPLCLEPPSANFWDNHDAPDAPRGKACKVEPVDKRKKVKIQRTMAYLEVQDT